MTRGEHFAALVAPHVADGTRVLDLGCGDLSIARALRARRHVDIVGTDVLTPARRSGMDDVPFVAYDGRALPLASKRVDTTYIAFVLHHTTDAELVLREAIRVTRRTLVVLEDVYTNALEKLLLTLFDTGNLLQAPDMRLPFAFRTEREWMALFRELGAADVASTPIRPAIPKPTRHRKFVVTL